MKKPIYFALVVILLSTISGCYKEANDTTGTVHKVSEGPWAVNGIHLGMSVDECRRILGEPKKSLIANAGQTILKWEQPNDVIVTFDKNSGGAACEIVGDTLTDLAGKVIIWSSASEEDVKAILKKVRIEKHYRPSGSGVISLGRTLVGTSYTCTDSRGSYCISFQNIQIVNIRATTRLQ